MQRKQILSQIRLLQERALPAVRQFLGSHRASPTYAMQLHADDPDKSIRIAFQPSGLPAATNGGTLMIDVAPETLAFHAQFAGGPGLMPYSYFLPPITRAEVEHTAIIDRIQCFVEDGIDYFRLAEQRDQPCDLPLTAIGGFRN